MIYNHGKNHWNILKNLNISPSPSKKLSYRTSFPLNIAARSNKKGQKIKFFCQNLRKNQIYFDHDCLKFQPEKLPQIYWYFVVVNLYQNIQVVHRGVVNVWKNIKSFAWHLHQNVFPCFYAMMALPQNVYFGLANSFFFFFYLLNSKIVI